MCTDILFIQYAKLLWLKKQKNSKKNTVCEHNFSEAYLTYICTA